MRKKRSVDLARDNITAALPQYNRQGARYAHNDVDFPRCRWKNPDAI